MTAIEKWIHVSMGVMKDSSDKLSEYLEAGDIEGAKIQNDALKKQVLSYIAFLKNKEKFG
jgi:hypothetical protein